MGRHAAAKTDVRRTPVNKRLVTVIVLFALVVLVIDQVTKFLAIEALSDGSKIPLIGSWLSLQLTYNSGAAFSFASGATWIFTILATVVIVVVVRIARRIGSVWWAVCLGLLLGGAAGNLIDRLFREPSFGQGHVVDFLNYGDYFIGNVADIAIVVAAIGVAVLAVVGLEIDGSRTGRPAGTDAAADRESAEPGEDVQAAETAAAEAPSVPSPDDTPAGAPSR